MTTLFVPEGSGPYNVDGAEYPVSDGKVECNNRDHIPMLKALGASEFPIIAAASEAAPVGERIPSDFGPTQAEHDSLRAKHDALVAESENQIAEIDAYKVEFGKVADVIVELGFPIEEGSAADNAVRLLREYRALLDTPPEEAPAADDAADTADKGDDASGGTSSGADDATKLVDPGFTADSDYQEILSWLKANEVDVPGNISKANALEAVAAKLAEANKE